MRSVTIYLDELVDENKRRERRRGAIAGMVLLATLGLIVGKTDNDTTTAAPQTVTVTKTVTVFEPSPPTETTATTATAAPALPARLTVTPPQAMLFEPLSAGSASPARLVTVRNAGGEPLTIRDVALRGAGFRITNDCAGSLASGASCKIAVVFAPAASGDQRGTLTIATSTETSTITLRGTARAIPPVELAPLDFGRQQSGAKVAPQRVRFVNSGASPVAIADVALTPAGPFSIAQNRCEGVVPPGGECDVLVAFAPTEGAFKGELWFTGSSSLVAHTTITGSGFTPAPPPETVHLDIKPRELRFLFGVTPPQRITITNPGATPVKIFAVRAVGGGRSFKIDARQCEGRTLQPRGGACVIVVGATASYRQLESMQIQVEHSGAPEPDTIGASGSPRQ